MYMMPKLLAKLSLHQTLIFMIAQISVITYAVINLANGQNPFLPPVRKKEKKPQNAPFVSAPMNGNWI